MRIVGLNESPRPKAGKFNLFGLRDKRFGQASMKVPARRRGNEPLPVFTVDSSFRLNESPRPKAGKSGHRRAAQMRRRCLNESPRPKAGKCLRPRRYRGG